MRSSRPLTITLPDEMARLVKARVASGDYASESEVVRAGLRALREQEQALERWLSTEGVARFDAYSAGGVQTSSAQEAEARLDRHMAARTDRDDV